MNSSKLFLSLLFSAGVALCQINITGKVIDTSGNPVRGAQVSLTVAGIKDTTDSAGQFVLASGSTGNPLNKTIKPLYGSPFIKNHVLFFFVLRPGTQILVDVFNVSGRLVAHVLNRSFENGNFRLDLAALTRNSSKNAINVVRLKIGNEAFTIKWSMLGATIGYAAGGSSGAPQNAFSKVTAPADSGAVDTIVATRDGYFDEYKTIFLYVQDVGTIKMFNGKMPTVEQQDSMKNVINAVSMVVSKTDTIISTDSAMKLILHQCDTMKMIDSMWISGSFVCAKIKYGGICTWDFTKDSLDTSAISSLQKVQISPANPVLHKIGQVGQSACVLLGGGDEIYNQLEGKLNSVYSDLVPFYGVVDRIYKANFSVNFISEKLYKYDLVYLLTHGLHCANGTYFLTGEKVNIVTQFLYNHGLWYCNLVCFNLPKTGPFTSADWLKMVSDRYISEKCNKQFNARLWYAAACDQLHDPAQMGKTLVDHGVKEVVGWNCEVNGNAAIKAGQFLIDSMLSRCSSLSESYGFLKSNHENKMYTETGDPIECNLTTCYQTSPPNTETGRLMSYPDDINTSAFKLRTDCVTTVPPLDISAASYTGKRFTFVQSPAQRMTFSADGTHVYILSIQTYYEYNLSTAWDVSTASYANKSKNVLAQDTNPWDLRFSLDGTRMYVLGSNKSIIYQYTLSTPWDISTASYSSVSASVGGQDNNGYGIFFSDDGSKMYYLGNQHGAVFEYTLSTPWNIGTITYANVSFNLLNQENVETIGLWFVNGGNNFCTVGYGQKKIFEYSMSTPWNISTASYTGKSFSSLNQDSTIYEVGLNPDCSAMYLLGYQHNTVYQYSFPGTPTLTSPVDGSAGQPLTPTLTWSTVTGAASYHVQVSTGNTFSTILIEDSTLTSASKALNGLTNGTQYFWRVRAKNAGGVSGWTSPWSFTTIIATLPGMVAIPAGTFMMGKTGIQYAEPVHQVTLSAFWMDITEVTQKDYLALMHFNPSYYQGDVNRPVEQVTWYDAVLYCNARSKRDGLDTVYLYSSLTGTPGNGCTSLGNLQIDYSKKGYRLPTEAEFEYALRAGTTTLCFWGNDSTAGGNYAWCGTNSGNSTHPVATKLPNPWGLYDIAGNVEEWNNDWETDANYPDGNPQIDPIGPPTGTFGFISKSLRGGLYWDLGYYMRSAQRGCHYPYNRDQGDGFRCVLPRK